MQMREETVPRENSLGGWRGQCPVCQGEPAAEGSWAGASRHRREAGHMAQAGGRRWGALPIVSLLSGRRNGAKQKEAGGVLSVLRRGLLPQRENHKGGRLNGRGNGVPLPDRVPS